MARKEVVITIDDKSRDNGKTFKIVEMDAVNAERWALRALFALMGAGVEVPDDIGKSGMSGLFAIGLQALGKLPFHVAEPLLEEMWECVHIIRDTRHPEMSFKPTEDDVEEVSTRLKLRTAVMKLHLDFFTAAAGSTSRG
ncbi:hypothetical protein PCO31110_01595 [Pandoraea communis]|uniref:Uncharacterized protein n=1 Tax=Pandoraea communis TaxID=2508297 RepID=A0A5E4TRX4_9BURK|nr:hypothetical protein [Pandoraea communis]VVD90517.1 hypothetical protein PCO31110_01595 [Pandoraea communis]